MTATPQADTATPVPADLAVERRLLRSAGLGGVLAVASWLGQPIVVGALTVSEGDTAPSFELLEGRPYSGAIEAAIFLGVCIGLFAFVGASARLLRLRRGSALSTWAVVGVALGLVGAAAWAFVAGASLVPFTSIGPGVAGFAPDPGHEVAMLGANALVIGGLVFAGMLGLAGYIVCLATAGRRAGVIGWPTTIAGLAALAVFAIPLAVPFTPPWGFIGILAFVLVAAVVFLIRSRRGRGA